MAKESKQEKIGFRKGCISTLTNERNELLRIVGILESMLQMHTQELESLGVDLSGDSSVKKPKKPIEELLG